MGGYNIIESSSLKQKSRVIKTEKRRELFMLRCKCGCEVWVGVEVDPFLTNQPKITFADHHSDIKWEG